MLYKEVSSRQVSSFLGDGSGVGAAVGSAVGSAVGASDTMGAVVGEADTTGAAVGVGSLGFAHAAKIPDASAAATVQIKNFLIMAFLSAPLPRFDI